ncbi:Cytochrome b-c1 complex subunit 7 [Lemmus lemmus]
MFHIRRAPDLILRHQTLPMKQQTKYEEEKFSPEPYLKDVLWGSEAKEEWAKG